MIAAVTSHDERQHLELEGIERRIIKGNATPHYVPHHTHDHITSPYASHHGPNEIMTHLPSKDPAVIG